MPHSTAPYYAVLAAVLVLAAGGGGYFLGMSHQKSIDATASTASTADQSFGGTRSLGNAPSSGSTGSGYGGGYSGGYGGGAGRMGGGLVAGEITSLSGNTLTVQGRNGTSSTVTVSSATTISKFVTGATSDLATGQTVTVTGTAAADGSVQATAIQVRPASTAGTQ